MPPAQLFLDHLPHIEKVVAHLCRRYHFRKEEHEDFLSHVKVKLIEDDYAVIRKFQGKSNLKTYLTTCISNLMRDHQNHLWGKWRPSAEALRLGPVAILLDKLLRRDGYSFEQAVQILQVNHKVEMSWQELADIAARLPIRSRPEAKEEEELEDHPSPSLRPDAQLIAKENETERRRIFAMLREARQALPQEDQLILTMLDGSFSVADISRTLRLDQKQLYRHIKQIYKGLCEELGRRGIRKEDLDGLLDD